MAGLNEVDYEPAEVAVVRFSLKNGIEAVFHKIMYWELELGYRRFHTEHSQKTHQIPDKYELGEKNYKNVYNELMQFIAPDGDLENLPPLYCYDKENIAPVKSFVKRIANASGKVQILTSIEFFNFEKEHFYKLIKCIIFLQVSRQTSSRFTPWNGSCPNCTTK